MTSSDGVPPELAVLGFQRSPAWTGQTGRRHRSDRPTQGFVGVDRLDDRSRVLAHSSVLAWFCVNTRSDRTAAIWLTIGVAEQKRKSTIDMDQPAKGIFLELVMNMKTTDYKKLVHK